MIDVLAQYQPRAHAYPNRVREGIATLVSYASNHLTRSRQESVPVPQKIDLSEANLDNGLVEALMREHTANYYSSLKPTILSQNRVVELSPSIDKKIRRAIELGEIDNVLMNADLGNYTVFFERITPVNGSYYLRVFYILERKPINLPDTPTPTKFSFHPFLLEYFRKKGTKKQKLATEREH